MASNLRDDRAVDLVSGMAAGCAEGQRDIADRQRMEAELAAAKTAMAGCREAERLRLAQDLHDGIVQELVALRYQLAASVERRASGGPESDLRSTVEHVEARLAEVVGELRELIGELRPPRIEDVDLRGALECCVASVVKERVPMVRLDVEEDTGNLPGSTALCIFRVAQEAIRNAVEHAEAERVVVRVRQRANQVRLLVSDDGCGFDVPECLAVLAWQGHFGLSGVAERVGSSNGRLRIRSRPGRGTTVAVRLAFVRGAEAVEIKHGKHPGSAG